MSNEVEEADSYDVRQNLKTFHREENTDEYCVVFRVEKAMKSCLFNEDTKKLTNGQCQEDHFLFIDWLKMYFLFRCRYLCVMWKQVHKTSSWWQMLRWAVPETLRWLLHWLMCRSDVTNYIIVLVLIHKPFTYRFMVSLAMDRVRLDMTSHWLSSDWLTLNNQPEPSMSKLFR